MHGKSPKVFVVSVWIGNTNFFCCNNIEFWILQVTGSPLLMAVEKLDRSTNLASCRMIVEGGIDRDIVSGTGHKTGSSR